MIIVLADIRSAHNVGSLFRTADASGCTKLYLCGITPCPRDRFGRINPEISKVALGAEEWLPWEHVRSCTHLLDRLKKEGYAILALEQSKNSIAYTKVRNPKKEWDKTVLVVGNEVDGLFRAILNRADSIIEIPMYGKKESLNVAVAFGIVAFALRGSK
ncbi:MAG: TrmH family RNA methyltransferase [Candidatus Uhrbacteria bacterium]|nr:TrmH family RNA methyltransferase [Candidatus Uhrbacteria bacterium]